MFNDFSDRLVNIFPKKEGGWTSDVPMHVPGVDTTKTQSFKQIYKDLVFSAYSNNSWQDVNLILEFVKKWQNNYAQSVELPSEAKINSEIFYNNLDPFGWTRLFLVYFLSGCLLLFILLIDIFYDHKIINFISSLVQIIIYSGFAFTYLH